MNKKSIGLYIHIPFCIKKCNYCDFCSFDDINRDEYISALCNEIKDEAKKLDGYCVDTVFFGGGTPSLLSCASFERLFSLLRDNFDIAEGAEITAEINPATADYEKLSLMRALGINRLSIGMQSANDKELQILGRAHNQKDFDLVFATARKAGFDNINVDLMYGIPCQTESTFNDTLNYTLSLGCEHISAYALKIEENTPFYYNKDKLILPDEDEEYAMYMNCAEKLSSFGYKHYEISNYAKKERECKHNLKYWKCLEYIGLGASAYSYFGKERYGNTSDVSEYMKKRGLCQKVNVEKIDTSENEYEYIMLGLRLQSGIDDREFKEKFGISFSEKYERVIKKFASSEFFSAKEGRFYLTDKGMYVSNSILCEFLEKQI